MKKIISITLVLVILAGMFSISVFATNDYGKTVLEPIYTAKNHSVSAKPTAITDTIISDFTAVSDYTVKADKNAIITFDMDNADWKNIYFNDFNNGEVLSSASPRNISYNNGSAFVLFGSKKYDGNAYFETDPIVSDVCDFEFSFDVVTNEHIWTETKFHMRTNQYYLYICNGYSAEKHGSTEEPVYMHFINNSTGEEVLYTDAQVRNTTVRIVAIGKTCKVYLGDKLAIDYVAKIDFVPQTGTIYATNTDCPITYDNIRVNIPRGGSYNPESDSYYEVSLGQRVTLGRRINGTYTKISESTTALNTGKTYNFKVMRNAGSVTVTADDSEVLKSEIAFPYTEGGVTLCRGLIGTAASANDTLQSIAVYDSTNLNFNGTFAEILPYSDAVKDAFTISAQGAWSQNADTFIPDAAYNIVSDNEFTITSPSQVNGWVNIDNILNKNHSDVYITFDISCSRDNYTADEFYFAGYSIYLEAFKPATTAPTVKSPLGGNITASNKYVHFCFNTFTFEFIKKGNTVSVYYYPKGSERDLLFTDSNCTAATTNFSIYRRQGVTTIKNFTVYDAVPTDTISTFNLFPQSAYMKTDDGIGFVPMGTTVHEVKTNLLNNHTVNIYRGNEILAETDTVLTGDIIRDNELASVQWVIGTLADLNGDGKVTNDDVALANTANTTTGMNPATLTGADMDQNGIINAADITVLQNIVAGKDDMTYIKRSIVGEMLLEQFKTVGRQYYESNRGVNFEWSSASITIAGYMKDDVKITLDYDSGAEGIDDGFIIYVDGDKSKDNYTSLISGVNTYTVASGLSAGYHTVEILKNNSSIEDAFYMLSVDMTGKPEKVAPAARKIEFLGDSITAGCGVLPNATDNGAHYQHYTYAAVASRALGADFYAMANSGWGFANHLKYPYTIERIYELATDRRDPELAHDFSTWQPDLVVVNLGTNDNTVVSNQYSAAVKAGTEFDFATAKSKYQASVVTLLDKIRKNNPNAKIIWTYGAMGYGLTDNEGNQTGDWIKDAVAGWNETNGGATFYHMPASQNGGGGHPESIGSKYLGEGFAKFIAEYMGWEYSTETPETYEYGEVIKDYTFDDGTTEGVYTNNLSYVSNNNGRLQLNSEVNYMLGSSPIVGNSYLDTYEMNLEWTHSGASVWNRETIILRSPDSGLDNAIYLTTLGSSLAVEGNYYNPLKNTTDNLQLVATVNGKITRLGSMKVSNLFAGTNIINVKMGINHLEITIYKSGETKPTEPTFSVNFNEDIAPTHGDIFFESRNSNNLYDNINIVYGVAVDLAGDLDKNGVLNAKDIVSMRKFLLGFEEEIYRFALDANRDSKIDILDLIRIKKNMTA